MQVILFGRPHALPFAAPHARLRYQVPDPAGGGISGAADGRHGATHHLETAVGPTGPESHVIRVDRDGTRTVVSDDLWAHEKEDNPDEAQTYGFSGLDDQCVAEVAALEQSIPPGPEGGPLLLNEHPGIIESNAYQLTVDRGTAYVADAAANAILAVDLRSGGISTLAVIPGSAVTFTEQHKAYVDGMLGGATLPDCVVGASYTPEPVPTDVEVGKDGRLYVSTLQGALGEAFPLSTVYKVSPRSGHTRTVADRGMQGATGLAVAPNGDILVAEMFGDAISTITPGRSKARTLFEADAPADVEFARGTVYATTGVFGEDGAPGNGAVVSYHYRSGR
ncbi:ScyD/ScyE family protein [Brachybacterium paraconglomeratum]